MDESMVRRWRKQVKKSQQSFRGKVVSLNVPFNPVRLCMKADLFVDILPFYLCLIGQKIRYVGLKRMPC